MMLNMITPQLKNEAEQSLNEAHDENNKRDQPAEPYTKEAHTGEPSTQYDS